MFRIMLEERCNALLMSEETMNYYQYNYQNPPIIPKGINLAISYLMKILQELLNFNQDQYSEMSKLIKKVGLQYVKKDELVNKSFKDIINEFNTLYDDKK